MAASLLALLSQQGGPTLSTRKGLVVLGLQNDYSSLEVKLPVSSKSEFLHQLKRLVSAFRESGTVIWVRGQERPAETKSPSRHLQPSEFSSHNEGVPGPALSRSENCSDSAPGGAKDVHDVQCLIDSKRDSQIVKTDHSAFEATKLLSILRTRLITELFLCGCNTKSVMYATAMDAASYGINVTIIEDCFVYVKKVNHDKAVNKLRRLMDAKVMTAADVLVSLRPPSRPHTAITLPTSDVVTRQNRAQDSALVADSDESDLELEINLADFRSSRFPQPFALRPRKDLEPVVSSRRSISPAHGPASGLRRHSSLRTSNPTRSARNPNQRASPARPERRRPSEKTAAVESALHATHAALPRPNSS